MELRLNIKNPAQDADRHKERFTIHLYASLINFSNKSTPALHSLNTHLRIICNLTHPANWVQ